ncbi:NAD(+)/NADH kinase [Treponema pedis]|uniref:NAD kinase n=2 Tax=Treponema pedis TaxID=409322 RepID=S6A165_9SPIR|nr:NAD(+)/NADH kinase [Treponema pedis]AGT44523.1 inorganic polyphosphate/ATP-NAD kinase [Treponema pedis str. T A4]QOW59839.1 NAD(+)/NADH kinase [Treponema pedis]
MKSALIVVSTDKPETEKLSGAIGAFLKENGIDFTVYEYSGYSHLPGLKSGFDFAVSLGGDGTVLFTARYCAPRNIPVFPINFGRFGFIANIEPNEWKAELINFLNGKSELHERSLLSVAVKRKEKITDSFEALNDAVISGAGIAKLINLDIGFNGISFGTFRADGVIVSTPTGSTAYSAASGGPILDPSTSSFVLTPISPFSLSNRPLVLPSNGKMIIRVLPARTKEVILSVDGQEIFSLKEGDKIIISESPNKVKMAGCSPDNFYRALRSKLGWSGSSR